MSTARHIAFVSPRYPEGPAVGGAETMLKSLAVRAAKAGRDVEFLTTCASNHFTWANEIPPGTREIDGMRVHFFPVDEGRDARTFQRVQQRISRSCAVSETEEQAWLANSVNSRPLYPSAKSKEKQGNSGGLLSASDPRVD